MEINFDKSLDDVRKRLDVFHLSVPLHRMTPLKDHWETIVKTVVEHMKLQIRMNTKKKAVEVRVSISKLILLRPLPALPTQGPSRKPLTSSRPFSLALSCRMPSPSFGSMTYTSIPSISKMVFALISYA